MAAVVVEMVVVQAATVVMVEVELQSTSPASWQPAAALAHSAADQCYELHRVQLRSVQRPTQTGFASCR